jgi:hypothetical protein
VRLHRGNLALALIPVKLLAYACIDPLVIWKAAMNDGGSDRRINRANTSVIQLLDLLCYGPKSHVCSHDRRGVEDAKRD